MLVYLLNSSACLAIFLAFYKLFLEKENIHFFKRYYLLTAMVASFCIPFITFTTYVDPVTTTSVVFQQIEEGLGTHQAMEIQETESIDYLLVALWSIYCIGVLIFGVKFLLNLSDIFYKIKNNPKLEKNRITNVLLKSPVTPHTFFKYIFFNKQKFEAGDIPQEVFWHEETHAKQKHSIDILCIEVLNILLWFNPLIYFAKKAVKLNHEFLADQGVLNKGISLSAYQQVVLAFSSKQTSSSLANAINYSFIKKRFTVMKKKTNRSIIWIKTLVLIPLLAITLYSFGKHIEVEKTISSDDKLNDIILLVYQDETIELDRKRFKKDDLKDLLSSYDTKTNITIAYQYTGDNSIVKFKEDIYNICKNNGFDSIRLFVQAGTPANPKTFTPERIAESIRLSKNKWVDEISSFRRHKKQFKSRYLEFKNSAGIIEQKKMDYLVSLWNDLQSNYNNIPPEERISFNLIMPEHPKNPGEIANNDILILINSKNQVLIHNSGEVVKPLYIEKALLRYNEKLSSRKEASIIKVTIVTDVNASSNTVQKITSEISEMGFKNIILEKSSTIPNDRIPPPPPVRKENKDFYKSDKNKEKSLQDPVLEYKKKYKQLEDLKNQGSHYIHKSEANQKKMNALFAELGGMYFRLSKTNKAKVKKPENPILPYIRFKKDGKVSYKKRNELTEEEKEYLKNTLPPPPPPARSQGVTEELIQEYNNFVEPINKLPIEKRIIKVRDYTRIKYIYDSMTEEQRKNAEALPKFLVQPPPPPPVKKSSEKNTKGENLSKNIKFKVIDVQPKVKLNTNLKIDTIYNPQLKLNPTLKIDTIHINKKVNLKPKLAFEADSIYMNLKEIDTDRTAIVFSSIPPVNEIQGAYLDKSATYSKDIKTFLQNSGKSSNDELIIQYHELLRMYKVFTEEEKNKFKLLPPPPPPAKKNKK